LLEFQQPYLHSSLGQTSKEDNNEVSEGGDMSWMKVEVRVSLREKLFQKLSQNKLCEKCGEISVFKLFKESTHGYLIITSNERGVNICYSHYCDFF